MPPPSAEGPSERIGRLVAEHCADIARKVAALRRSEATTEAALARYDERWGCRR